jgi:signal peptidase II
VSPAVANARVKVPWLGFGVAALGLLADQLSKYIIIEKVMRPPGITETPFISPRVIEVLPIFDLRLSWNPGMSFSLFNSGESATIAVLLAARVIITGLLIWWLWRLDRPWLQISCGLIIGGALGNIVDVATTGAVADFLLFHWKDWAFPTFNVADSCITVGAGMWLLDAVLAHPHDTPTPKETT